MFPSNSMHKNQLKLLNQPRKFQLMNQKKILHNKNSKSLKISRSNHNKNQNLGKAMKLVTK